MNSQIYVVSLYQQVTESTDALAEQCIAKNQELAIALGDSWIASEDGKGWYDIQAETLH